MKTKKLIVNVMDTPVPVGMEAVYTSYPEDGLYLLTSGVLINRIGNMALYISPLPSPKAWEENTNPAPASGTCIDSNTLLKAIALAQNPELALELCK